MMSYLTSVNGNILEVVIQAIMVFIYQGTIMYIQFVKLNNSFHRGMTQFEVKDNKNLFHTVRTWVVFEIQCFYLYILSSVVFLMFIQVRGMQKSTER